MKVILSYILNIYTKYDLHVLPYLNCVNSMTLFTKLGRKTQLTYKKKPTIFRIYIYIYDRNQIYTFINFLVIYSVYTIWKIKMKQVTAFKIAGRHLPESIAAETQRVLFPTG